MLAFKAHQVLQGLEYNIINSYIYTKMKCKCNVKEFKYPKNIVKINLQYCL
jgi:hypothetical protein